MTEENKRKLEALKAKLEVHADALLVGIAASPHSWPIVAAVGAMVLVIGIVIGFQF